MNAILKIAFRLVLVILVTSSQSLSLFAGDDKQEINALADGFAAAMVKKDKAWMEANLTSSCITITPNDERMDRALTIKAFCGEIYDIRKSSSSNKSFMVDGAEAGGSADYTVEGFTKSPTETNEIAGTYRLSFKLNRSEQGWKIAEILINGN